MKVKVFSLLLVLSVIMAVSCKGPQGERAATGEAKSVIEADGDVFLASLETTVVEWIGTKPTGYHDGTISVKSGYVVVNEGVVTGGEIVIDMNSILVLDIEDPETNAKLRGHLLSADFFEVETYPEARFVITSVEEFTGEQTGEIMFTHMVSGNLSMKDVTRNITFPASIGVGDDRMKASSDFFIIDRSEWNIRFGSRKFFDNLRDNFIHDDIMLKITFEGFLQ